MARLSTHAAGATLNLKDRTRLADAIAALGPIDNLVVGVSADVAWGPFNTLKMDAELAALNMKLIGYLAAASRADEPGRARFDHLPRRRGRALRDAGTVGLAALNGALEAATRTLAKEIAPRRVNLVSPGLTHCPKNSARRCSPTLPRGCP